MGHRVTVLVSGEWALPRTRSTERGPEVLDVGLEAAADAVHLRLERHRTSGGGCIGTECVHGLPWVDPAVRQECYLKDCRPGTGAS